MKMLIINTEIAEKLRQTEFDGFNRLDPVKGDILGKEVYFLQAELKDNKIFAKALTYFEVCEIKEIETIKIESLDSKGTVTTDPTKIVTTKTILTASTTIWTELGVKYTLIDVVDYFGKYYQCLKPHTSAQELNPVDTINVYWKEVQLVTDLTILQALGQGIVDGASKIWEGITYVWDNIYSWFK